MSDKKAKIVCEKFETKESPSKISDVERNKAESNYFQFEKHQHQDEQIYSKLSHSFGKLLKEDYERLTQICNAVVHTEQERERQNMEEILYLNKVCNQMQNEIISIKRKKWCRYCESEATYLSADGKKFYCSQECEQKQTDFVSAINNIFATN